MPKPVNPIRGEIKVKLGETEFVLVPEYERFAWIEGDLGCSVLQALERMQHGDIRTAVAVLSRGSDTELEPMEIGDLLMRSGGISGSGIRGDLYSYLAYPALGFKAVEALMGEPKPKESKEAPPAADGQKSAAVH